MAKGDQQYLCQRGQRWTVRVAVPKELRAHVGRTHVERTLGTQSLAEAKRRRHAVVASIFEMFGRARERRPLGEIEIKNIAEAELRRAYEQLAGNFMETHSHLSEWAAEMNLVTDFPLVAAIDQNPILGEAPYTYAERLIRQAGADVVEANIMSLAEAIIQAHVAAVEMLKRGLAPPTLPEGTTVRKRPRQGRALTTREAGEQYLAERQRDPAAKVTEQTAFQTRATCRQFGDHTNDAPIDSITRDEATSFLDTMAKLHPHYGRRRGAASLSLDELLKRYPAGDSPGLSNRTLNRHQSALKSLFRWARKRGMVEGENPFADLARPKGRGRERLPFKVDELNALFAGVQFEIEPRKHTFGAALPWAMAIALFSGMRAGELSELSVEDVQQEQGIWFFDVNEAKSEAGVRRTPVHSELVAFGLLDYIQIIGAGHLFPGLTPGGSDTKRGHTLSKRFPKYRRDRGVTRNRVVFHSFRKCFVRALEMAKVDRDRVAQVVGHERGFTFRVYNPEGVDLPALRDVVEAVHYPDLEISQ